MMRYLLLLAVAVAAHGQFGAATSVVSGNGAPVAAQCTNANNVGRVWARKDGGAASTTFYICAATGAGTYGWQLNDGAIGGAGNIAAGQVLYGTAAGVAGSEANLFWDAANNRLGVGTASPGFLTHFVGIAGTDSGWSRTVWQDATNATRSHWVNGLGFTTIGTITNDPFVFVTNNTDRARFTTTGNLLLGTTTDNNFRLDIAASGSSGTLRAYDQTPTTGATQLIVRAGAGQSTTNLQTWQSAAGAELTSVASDGTARVPAIFSNSGNDFWLRGTAGLFELRSTFRVSWSSTTSVFGAQDVSLSRASEKVLQVGDGGANALGALNFRSGTVYDSTATTGATQLIVRAGAGQSTTNLQTWQSAAGSTIASVSSSGDILARIHTWSSGTEGTCDATLRGQVVMVQGGAGVADRLRLCRKDATDTYLWAPVDNNVALQVVSAGPTATVTNQVGRVYVDPASVIASLTLTLPATPLDADRVEVYFGGTLANKAAVVTTLSIAPNTGHAISQFNAPVNAFGGDMVTYEYRAAAARWYRIQ